MSCLCTVAHVLTLMHVLFSLDYDLSHMRGRIELVRSIATAVLNGDAAVGLRTQRVCHTRADTPHADACH